MSFESSEYVAEQRQIAVGGHSVAVHLRGAPGAPAVAMSHSILSSSMMWNEQAALLARHGFRVVCIDTRGHGGSSAPPPPYAMSDLARDTIAVLDALDIARAHYVGLSLGGMAGFGLGIHYPERLASLVICDARADVPEGFASVWDERIAAVRRHGCGALAQATTERWFGQAFLAAHPDVAKLFQDTAAAASADGFIGSVAALLGLDYLPEVDRITAPLTLIVGADDHPFPQAMCEIQDRIPGTVLEVIRDAGHLPNIVQPAAFNGALLRHFERVGR